MSYLNTLFLNNTSYIIFFAYMIFTNILVSKLLGIQNSPLRSIIKNSSAFMKIGIFITLFLLAFIEEVVFRKYLNELLTDYFNQDFVHIITSLSFALIHITNIFLFEKELGLKIYVSLFVQITRTFILGMYLSLLYKNILYSTIFHLAFNLSQLLINWDFTKQKQERIIGIDMSNPNNRVVFVPKRRHSISGQFKDKRNNCMTIVNFIKNQDIGKMHDIKFLYKKHA